MTKSQKDNFIEFSPLEKQIMAALLEAERQSTPTCLDPETLLDLVEQGDKHPRYAELQTHLAGCVACRDEYDDLNQAWREARRLPAEPSITPHPSRSETPELSDGTLSSSRPSFVEWLRGLVFGGVGARTAWGAASLILLLTGWAIWQERQTRSALQSTQARLQTERAHVASLNGQVNQLQQMQQTHGTPTPSPSRDLPGPTNVARLAHLETENRRLQNRLADVTTASQSATQEAQRKVNAANTQITQLNHQIALVRNDTDTTRLMSVSLTGLSVDNEPVRGNGELRLRSPRMTCVLEQRPRFQWTLDNSALAVTEYEITIDGDSGYHRTKQLSKEADEWDMATEPTPAFPPLKRGAIYHWQIRALVANNAPIVSAAARFKVASQETVDRITQARHDDANRPLSLFKTYLQNGLIDEARRKINGTLDGLQTPTLTNER